MSFRESPGSQEWSTGAGLTAAKMKDCRWLKPVLVAQIEFLEWTGENHLRHTKFIALRDDKPAREVGGSRGGGPDAAVVATRASTVGPLYSAPTSLSLSVVFRSDLAPTRESPIDGCRRTIRSRARFDDARHKPSAGRGIDAHALTEFPGVLDGRAACGVIEDTPDLLGGRDSADGRS